MDLDENVKNSLYQRVYMIYDTKLQQFAHPLIIKESEYVNVFKQLVNNVTSVYYQQEDDFILYDFGIFNEVDGFIKYDNIKSLGTLSQFIDSNIRNVQVCIQTLNFLPVGYFKMPKEMQQDIQSRIDECIKSYVENFVDLDKVKISNTPST